MVQRRKGTKSSARRRKTMRKQKAGGWTDNLKNMLYPGGPEHKMYSGPGYDCPGVPVRPGHISGPGGPPGLPGLSLRGGGHGMGALGAGAFTTGATQELKQMGGRRRKTQRRQQRGGRWQSFPELGALNPMNGVGLASYAPILRAPCETGTHNALNPNPNNVQGLSTAVASVAGWTPMGPGAPVMRGGGKKQKRQQKKKGGSRKQQRGGANIDELVVGKYYKLKIEGESDKTLGRLTEKPTFMGSGDGREMYAVFDNNGVETKVPRWHNYKRRILSNFEEVAIVAASSGGSRKQRGGMFVGDANNRAYYAPTAGYSNLPMMPPVANNPGILMQTGYPARAFNQACMATH